MVAISRLEKCTAMEVKEILTKTSAITPKLIFSPKICSTDLHQCVLLFHIRPGIERCGSIICSSLNLPKPKSEKRINVVELQQISPQQAMVDRK